MVNNISLNCQPLKTAGKKLSFGADKQEKVQPEARKFSYYNAGKEFRNGVIAPIVNLVDDGVAGIAIMVGTGILTGALMRKLGSKVKIPMIAAFTGIGAFNVGKGVHQVAANRGNPEAQEKAFHHIGEGAAITGIAVVASKPALKGAPGVDASKISHKDAFFTCIKRTPDALKNCAQTVQGIFKNGWKKADLTETAAVTTNVLDVFDPTQMDSLVTGSVVKRVDENESVKMVKGKFNSVKDEYSEFNDMISKQKAKAAEAKEILKQKIEDSQE